MAPDLGTGIAARFRRCGSSLWRVLAGSGVLGTYRHSAISFDILAPPLRVWLPRHRGPERIELIVLVEEAYSLGERSVAQQLEEGRLMMSGWDGGRIETGVCGHLLIYERANVAPMSYLRNRSQRSNDTCLSFDFGSNLTHVQFCCDFVPTLRKGVENPSCLVPNDYKSADGMAVVFAPLQRRCKLLY